MAHSVKGVVVMEKDAPATVVTINVPDPFVTGRIALDQVEEAFAKMHDGVVLRSVVEL
jgi:Zn-dependent alcohol dehydrogenase